MDDSALPHRARLSLERDSCDGSVHRVSSAEALEALPSRERDVEDGVPPAEEDGPAECSTAPLARGGAAALAASDAAQPLVVEWRRLSAFVRVPDAAAPRRWCGALRAPPTKCRQILHGVQGIIKPGVMLGILGPSGSGKTSLLSILGRRSSAEVTGVILVNGTPGLPKAVRRRIGFVTQDDLMWTTLTVADTLMYAALLRLPERMPREEKRARVEGIIRMLGLEKCKNTIIGGAFQRGVSGGERKRTSIAVELLTEPSLLLLDEPTSGLDSTIAARLVATLRGLAGAGRAFLVTIHQPATRVFGSFDDVMLLSEGRVLYDGSPHALAAHFGPLGCALPAESNPADWLLDLASAEPAAGGEPVRAALLAAWAEAHPSPEPAPGEDDAHVYGAGERGGVLPRVAGAAKGLAAHAAHAVGARAAPGPAAAKWPTGFGAQVAVLTRRNIAARAEGVLDRWRLGQVVSVALLSGLLWLHVGNTRHTAKGMGDVAGLLFFELLFLIFLSMFGALFAFPPERAITIKERRSGFFRLSAYYVSRCLADLPLDVIVPCGFVLILYWMGALRAAAFVPHLLVVLVAVLVATSMGLLISALVMELKQAQAFASVFTLATMLCGGFYIQSVPAWLAWLKWLSFITHAYATTLKLEFPAGSRYECERGPPGALCDVRQSVRLAAIDWSLPAYVNVLILLAELAALRVATYFALRLRLR